jgi:hypothetical protein
MPDPTQSIFHIIKPESLQDIHLLYTKDYIDYKNGTGNMSSREALSFERDIARIKASYERSPLKLN